MYTNKMQAFPRRAASGSANSVRATLAAARAAVGEAVAARAAAQLAVAAAAAQLAAARAAAQLAQAAADAARKVAYPLPATHAAAWAARVLEDKAEAAWRGVEDAEDAACDAAWELKK